MACRWQPGMKITALLDALNSALAEPFALAWSQDSPRFLLVFTVVYAVAVIVAVTDQKNTRPGAEHGSAAWGDVFRLNKFYMDRHGSNLLLTQHFHIGIDGYKHKHNTNILIVGGSGAGKTRTYGVPNVLECACSMVITDPKSEILRKTGNLLERKGYEVIVFDLINPAASFCYNPFVYVHDDREVLTLIENLIQNTTPSHSKSSDPFWEKSETALLQALMLYLLHEAPPEEQNFSMVMEMIAAAEVHEDDDTYQSPLDILFERLEMREPDSIACKQYRIFKQAAGKTAKSILVSVGVRLAAFNLPSIAKLTMTDELHLQELGERKIALFCCIPDSDKSLNYLVGMIYTQLIQTLYRQADRVHKGRLPVPVHCLMDEYANISLPKDTFLSALATMRSRAIFCSIIVQNMAQLKAMYKDDWESLVGLCDEFLYLGGTEKETHKYVSELLGKETISTTSYNQSKGRSGSYSINHQQSGRDLMTPDEVRLLDNSKCMSSVSLPQELIDAINNVGFWDSIPLWAVTLIGGLLITVLSFTMILTVYGRMFSLWMYAAIAPIPLSTFAGEPTSSVGKNFIRSYAGVCLQGVVIALSCIIFSAISSSPPAVDTGASVVTAVWTYVGELAFNLLVLVGAIKGCERIVKEIMGL